MWGHLPKNNNPSQKCYECGRWTKKRHLVVPALAGGTKLLPLCETCTRAIVLKDILSLEPIKVKPKKRLVRKTKLTDQNIAHARYMRAEGFTIKEIAKAMGWSFGSAWKATR